MQIKIWFPTVASFGFAIFNSSQIFRKCSAIWFYCNRPDLKLQSGLFYNQPYWTSSTLNLVIGKLYRCCRLAIFLWQIEKSRFTSFFGKKSFRWRAAFVCRQRRQRRRQNWTCCDLEILEMAAGGVGSIVVVGVGVGAGSRTSLGCKKSQLVRFFSFLWQ